MDKFKALSTSSKVLIVVAGALVVIAVGCIIGVIATGGFNGI